ncbi:phosphoadenylyl-sulfate reductase [Microbacterium amylolyticum]|uniref:Adenosine 5'-phosphosulfate reductase n=1 Tax=Microbacterium amylolyticum TaxID=936337 RepID=A0ABS4ZIV0_9MICO|nr:phosphoadenylyl-sulfate reductase [Microbacterium amylolyticum]MBP2437215.1 phosphoadenosine phosphosulfate reductase [Microbacterium amylolyticum]
MTVSLAPRALSRRTAEELEEIARAGVQELGSGTDHEATAAEALEWVARTFGLGAVAVASSMANTVLPHLVSQTLPGVDVLFLDTGYHFVETIATRDEAQRQLDIRVVDITADLTPKEQDAAYGADLFATNAEYCCAMRKVEPLRDSLRGYEVWISGVRREEASTRALAPLVTFDHKNGLVKVNPLVAWTSDELYGYAAQHGVPMNLLLSAGYPSIGCEPCTQPVEEGADPRSGRWAGSAKVECGIHVI